MFCDVEPSCTAGL